MSAKRIGSQWNRFVGLLVFVWAALGGAEVSGPVIGIDLGTTYCCLGVWKDGQVAIIPNEQGRRATPSWVALTEAGEWLTGEAAKNQTAPQNTLFGPKRLLGGDEDLPKRFSPEEISARLLASLKGAAEAFLGVAVQRAVLACPVSFNDAQRGALKAACALAGLRVERIVPEPTAAALAFGLDSSLGADQTALVLHLGGGTLDVTLLTLDDGVFEALANSGDAHLGGADFDARLVSHLLESWRRQTGRDASGDAKAVGRLRREAERAKKELSFKTHSQIHLKDFNGGEDFSEVLSRETFEELNIDLFKKTLCAVDKVLEEAQLQKDEIHEVLLVGGSTHIPRIRQLLKDYFDGREPRGGIQPEEAVAYGTAVLAREPVQEWVLITDLAPLSQGLETAGGGMTVMVPRNSPVPTRQVRTFSTCMDNQEAVRINVYEGERARATDNHLLGSFEVSGLPPAPRGTLEVEVAFEVDEYGILTVTAEEKGTKKRSVVSFEGRLTEEEMVRMIREGEEMAEEDEAWGVMLNEQEKGIKDRLVGLNSREEVLSFEEDIPSHHDL